MGDAAAEHEQVGARRGRLAGTGHPRLVVGRRPGRADPGHEDDRVREARAGPLGVGGRADEPGAARRDGHRDPPREDVAARCRDRWSARSRRACVGEGWPAVAAPCSKPSTAARTITTPPAACVVRYRAPVRPTTVAARPTVVGMSCSLRSANTSRPSRPDCRDGVGAGGAEQLQADLGDAEPRSQPADQRQRVVERVDVEGEDQVVARRVQLGHCCTIRSWSDPGHRRRTGQQ